MMSTNLLKQLMSDHDIEAYSFYRVSGDNESAIYLREQDLSTSINQYECTPLGNRFLRFGVPNEKRIKAVLVALFPYDIGASSKNHIGVVDGFSYGYDYHFKISEILDRVFKNFKGLFNYQGEADICVDTSPYIDREIALYGGLGKYGKNQMLFHPEYGSQFFIGYLVFKEDISEKSLTGHQVDLSEVQIETCNHCSICEKICPAKICTFENADASKCIGMLTQSKRKLTQSEKKNVGRQLYGCSICQRVCPLNKKKVTPRVGVISGEEYLPIEEKKILLMSNREFKSAFGHMAFSWRSLWVYKRNLLINMANVGGGDSLDFLIKHPHLGKDENLSAYYFEAISELQKRLK